MRLADKTALITGAGDGIGRGIALAFAREGADVALCDINESALEETRRAVKGTGRQAWAQRVDVRNALQIEQFVEGAAQTFGGMDILVNNAAIMPVATIEETTVDVVDQTLTVNLRAAILFSKYCIPHLRRAGGGSIIHMGSVTGHNGHSGVSVYGATKGGLMALARGQAMELAVDNIRVNTVSPGTVDSPMLHRFLQEHTPNPKKARESWDRLHPRGKIGTIDEIASVFVFLACDESINITATDIRCDGGYCVQGQQPRS